MGEAPAGLAVCLVPRRYRKQPDWWVIDVVGVEAPGGEAVRFRLSCPADGLWGTEGIEIEGLSASIRIPRHRAPGTSRFGRLSVVLRSRLPRLRGR